MMFFFKIGVKVELLKSVDKYLGNIMQAGHLSSVEYDLAVSQFWQLGDSTLCFSCNMKTLASSAAKICFMMLQTPCWN